MSRFSRQGRSDLRGQGSMSLSCLVARRVLAIPHTSVQQTPMSGNGSTGGPCNATNTLRALAVASPKRVHRTARLSAAIHSPNFASPACKACAGKPVGMSQRTPSGFVSPMCFNRCFVSMPKGSSESEANVQVSDCWFASLPPAFPGPDGAEGSSRRGATQSGWRLQGSLVATPPKASQPFP